MTSATAFIALGGNLGDRLATLRSAVAQLDAHPAVSLSDRSKVYETTPVGPSSQPFLNAVIRVQTRLDPPGLLAVLHAIESAHGRRRRVRWDARTLDLDLLLFFALGQEAPTVCEDPACALPHPSMLTRDFVLAPLLDVAPDLTLQGQTLVAHLAGLGPAARTILRDFDGLSVCGS